MCDPITQTVIAVVGVAAAAAGTVVTTQQQAAYRDQLNKSQQDKEQASNAARVAEQARQKKFEDQSEAQFQQQLGDQSPAKYAENQQIGVDEALNTTQDVQKESNLDRGLLPGQTGSTVSDVFTKDAARESATKQADANKRIQALAQLSGYDRANGYSTLSGNRYDAGQKLLATSANRSLRLGEQEGQTATPYVGAPSGIGQAISGLGNLGVQYGSKGAEKTLGNIFSSTPTTAA